MALDLLEDFFENHSSLKIKCVLVDAFCASADFVKKASQMQGGIQVISQIRSSQLIRNKMGLIEAMEAISEGVSCLRLRGLKLN